MLASEPLLIKVINWAPIRWFLRSTSLSSCQDARVRIFDQMQPRQQAEPSLENLHWGERAHLTNLNHRHQLASQQIALEVRWQDTIKVVQPQTAYLQIRLAKTWLRLKCNLTSLDSKWLADPNTRSCISRINKSSRNRWEARAHRLLIRV